MKQFVFFIMVLFSSTTIFSQEETPSEVPKIMIKLPFNTPVTIDGREVTFIQLLEDSRCPKQVDCIWEGRAKILVQVIEGDKPPLIRELLFGATKPGEQFSNVLFRNATHQFLGASLLPYPTIDVKKVDTDYILLVYKIAVN